MYRNIEPYVLPLEKLEAWNHPTCDDLEKRSRLIIHEARRIGDDFLYAGVRAARIAYCDLQVNDHLFERVLIFEKKPDNNIPPATKRHLGSHNGFTVFNGHWYALKPNHETNIWTPVRPLHPSFRPFGILDPYANCFEIDYAKLAAIPNHTILTHE